jgi:RNA polymerase sigma-70 factor (sigma-E family)
MDATAELNQQPGGVTMAENPGSAAGDAVIETVPVLTFDALYENAYPDMVRLAYLMVDSNAVAEELVQDAFVKVHAKWRSIEHPRAYLRTAVVNGCRNERRRRQVVRRLGRKASAENIAEAHPDLLADALARLAPDRRAALILRYYEDLPVQEVADILGVAPGTVKSMVHRALAELREVIDR